jgi:3-oxoacid CoA-transferase subunit B
LPLTGAGVVDLIVTDQCVFSCDTKIGGLTLIELAPGVVVGDVTQKTGTDFAVALT